MVPMMHLWHSSWLKTVISVLTWPTYSLRYHYHVCASLVLFIAVVQTCIYISIYLFIHCSCEKHKDVDDKDSITNLLFTVTILEAKIVHFALFFRDAWFFHGWFLLSIFFPSLIRQIYCFFICSTAAQTGLKQQQQIAAAIWN